MDEASRAVVETAETADPSLGFGEDRDHETHYGGEHRTCLDGPGAAERQGLARLKAAHLFRRVLGQVLADLFIQERLVQTRIAAQDASRPTAYGRSLTR